MDKEKLEKMTLREVFEYTKYIPIAQGGLAIFFEKLVSHLEYLEKRIEDTKK